MKYTYCKVLQELVEGKWEDSVMYDKSDKKQIQECRDDAKAYRREGYIVRVIERRILNPTD